MKNICTEQKDLPRGTAGQVFLCSTQHRLRERRRCAAMRIGRRRRSMNDYVTVDRVKMTKLYPEGGAEAPPVADAAKICWRPRCAATRIRAPKYAPGKFFSLRSRPIDPLPAKTKKEGYTKVYPSACRKSPFWHHAKAGFLKRKWKNTGKSAAVENKGEETFLFFPPSG